MGERKGSFFNGGERMTTYLVIITTILVLTQIIRVIQNAIQLGKYEHKITKQNDEIINIYIKLEKALDVYLGSKKPKGE